MTKGSTLEAARQTELEAQYREANHRIRQTGVVGLFQEIADQQIVISHYREPSLRDRVLKRPWWVPVPARVSLEKGHAYLRFSKETERIDNRRDYAYYQWRYCTLDVYFNKAGSLVLEYAFDGEPKEKPVSHLYVLPGDYRKAATLLIGSEETPSLEDAIGTALAIYQEFFDQSPLYLTAPETLPPGGHY